MPARKLGMLVGISVAVAARCQSRENLRDVKGRTARNTDHSHRLAVCEAHGS